jgi:hypothetical protein
MLEKLGPNTQALALSLSPANPGQEFPSIAVTETTSTIGMKCAQPSGVGWELDKLMSSLLVGGPVRPPQPKSRIYESSVLTS